MTQRTDIHRPIDMDPEAYEYVFAFDNGPGGLVGIMSSEQGREMWAGFMRDLNRSPLAEERGTHQCHHCGARIRYVALMRYIETGEIIAVGETCLSNRFELASKADFDRLRKAAALDRQAQRIKTAAAEFVAALPAGDVKVALTRETDLLETFGFVPGGYPVSKIEDYRNKLWNRYGSLFDSGLEYIGKLIRENEERKVRAGLIAAERANETTVEAPEGRIEFSGVVIKRVEKYSDFDGGLYVKLTIKVKNAAGEVWLCNVTEPSKVETTRGDVVSLRATLKRSDNPEFSHFAFGKRPSNFEILRHEELGEADALADPDSL